MARGIRPWVVGLAGLVALVACGGAGVTPSSDLPRTTRQGIRITVTDTVETLPLMGCRTYWMMNHGDSPPPPGTCERTVTVHHFTAARGSAAVQTDVVGDPGANSLLAMHVVGRAERTGLLILVVVPPPNAALLRVVAPSGRVVDQVRPAGGLVALAGSGVDLTVEALSADGSIIASCPPGGVIVGDVGFECTPAAGAPIVTTTTFAPGP